DGGLFADTDMINPFTWIETHIPPWVFITLVVHLVVLGSVAYMILLERKVASWVQDRIGPNRTGLGFGIIPFLKDKKMAGLGQPLADGLKFILKEDYQPKGVDYYLFTLAPVMMVIVIIVSIATIPWGGVRETTAAVDITNPLGVENQPQEAYLAAKPGEALNAKAIDIAKKSMPNGDEVIGDPVINTNVDETGVAHVTADVKYRYAFQISSLNIGVLFILAVLSLSVYGVVIGGWASNNKYSFLGGLRATANMISYEIPLGLAVLCIVVIYGSLSLDDIVNKQAHYWLGFIPAWNVFTQPLAFLMFLICIHAEANRAPFDMAEAEQELVGGYHTEYSSMRFALFFLAEYAGMVTTSAVCVALFFGGWHLPWIDKLPFAWAHALGGNVDTNHPEITTSLIAAIVRSFVFFGKVVAIIFVFMWVRWSLPRFRFDQLMMLAWRALIPISLAMLMMTAIVVYFVGGASGPDDYLKGTPALVFFLANIGLLGMTMFVSTMLPAAPDTNRKVRIPGSRFNTTALPAGTTVSGNGHV
ncbi:MAG: nuoH, partial [Phycisphaerales bacterium]|nr:nuoH [Phycisphaerales bacterium]